MDRSEQTRLQDAYLLVAELLLPPGQRDRVRIDATLAMLDEWMPSLAERLRSFIAQPTAWSDQEYTTTLELSPPCPLYTGAYLFDEPSTCRGAGLSGRNGYMLELKRIYEHFGLELECREMPDHLPLMIEFLALSLPRQPKQALSLRRRLLERLVLPALAPMSERLSKYECAYASLIGGLEALVQLDLSPLKDVPMPEMADRPPIMSSKDSPRRGRGSLPVLDSYPSARVSIHNRQVSDQEVTQYE